MSDDLLVNLTGDVLEITLNRPERGNGMSDDMIRHLADVVEAEHEKARLIVLRANGDDFCIGRANMGAARPGAPEALPERRHAARPAGAASIQPAAPSCRVASATAGCSGHARPGARRRSVQPPAHARRRRGSGRCRAAGIAAWHRPGRRG